MPRELVTQGRQELDRVSRLQKPSITELGTVGPTLYCGPVVAFCIAVHCIINQQ